MEHARQQDVAAVDTRIQALVSDAKAAMGVWSEHGLMETRRLFWDSYESGKVFARRQTFYDAVFAVIYGRTEEHFLAFILKWLFNTLVNFTVGMSVAVMAFIFKLPGLLWSFQASLVRCTCCPRALSGLWNPGTQFTQLIRPAVCAWLNTSVCARDPSHRLISPSHARS